MQQPQKIWKKAQIKLALTQTRLPFPKNFTCRPRQSTCRCWHCTILGEFANTFAIFGARVDACSMYTISYRQKGLRMRDRTTVHHNLKPQWLDALAFQAYRKEKKSWIGTPELGHGQARLTIKDPNNCTITPSKQADSPEVLGSAFLHAWELSSQTVACLSPLRTATLTSTMSLRSRPFLQLK